jgi:hypothetical protein
MVVSLISSSSWLVYRPSYASIAYILPSAGRFPSVSPSSKICACQREQLFYALALVMDGTYRLLAPRVAGVVHHQLSMTGRYLYPRSLCLFTCLLFPPSFLLFFSEIGFLPIQCTSLVPGLLSFANNGEGESRYLPPIAPSAAYCHQSS